VSAGDVEWVGVGGPAYDFTEQQDILSSDKEETTVDIGIEILGEETFDCVLEYEVSWSCQRLRKALVAKHPFIPNWSQLLKTPISFLPSRSDTMSFSVDQSSQSLMVQYDLCDRAGHAHCQSSRAVVLLL